MSWYDYGPRLAVAGGVQVPRPGVVDEGGVAAELLEWCAPQWRGTIAARGRTYARAGQVVDVEIGERTVTGRIQGSDPHPYAVHIDATRRPAAGMCSCPYGARPGDWCKHLAALAYVAAARLDTDDAAAAAWAGGQDREIGGVAELDADERAALRAALAPAEPSGDAAGVLAAAAEVLPVPAPLAAALDALRRRG